MTEETKTTQTESFIGNLKNYLMDILDVFYLILNTDMIQTKYKNARAVIISILFKELEEMNIYEPLLEKKKAETTESIQE